MSWNFIKAALAALGAIALAAENCAADSFNKGAAIHNLLNWADVLPADPLRYAWPPFDGAAHEVSDGVLRNLRKAGFDFIRLTVDPGPFLQFRGAERDALDALLVNRVRRLLDRGLAVMVDFHPNEHVPAFAPVRLVQDVDDPLFRDYAGAIRRTAALLAPLGPKVALELMNEPPYGWDRPTTRRWQRMLEILHAEARAAAPDLLLVLTGARGGSREGLVALDPAPFARSKVLYTFHYYEPHDFTHQGVETQEPGARHWRYLSALPYPTTGADRGRVLAQVEANVLSDESLGPAERQRRLREIRGKVLAYLASDVDRDRIGRDFDAVAAWARRCGVDPHAVLLGEFGVTRTYGPYRAAEPASREAWLRDVRQAAERRGFRWAIWEVKGYGGMAILANDDAEALDRSTLRALGLAAE